MNKKTRTNHDELESLFFNLFIFFTLNDKFVLNENHKVSHVEGEPLNRWNVMGLAVKQRFLHSYS